MLRFDKKVYFVFLFLGLMWHLKLKILPMKVEDTPNSLEMPRLISFLLQREGRWFDGKFIPFRKRK